jgi:hypothetical protein
MTPTNAPLIYKNTVLYRRYMFRRHLRQRSPTGGPRTILVVRGEIWTLFAIFMFIILFHYIMIRLRVTDTGSLTIFVLLR